MVNVMVAEDNQELNLLYCQTLSREENIKIISRTYDGESTLREYAELKPDILLLDLELPKIDGLDIINSLSADYYERKKCNVIVLSDDDNKRAKLSNTSKVLRIFPKNDELDNIKMTINSYIPYSSSLKTRIKNLLLDLGFKPSSKGTAYTVDAIRIAYSKPYLKYNIKDLYGEVAQNNHLSVSEIQWSIRNSLDTMNRNISKENLHSIFHVYTCDTVSPKDFFH